MKKILIPTDFSENANNALRYAINIANYFEAEVHLLHIFEVKTSTGSFKSTEEYIRENAERDLADNMRAMKKNVLGKTTLKGRAIKGVTVDVVCSIATHEKMDLIVMGTQGATGLKEVFLGSKTAGVMKRTSVPILAVPNKFTYRPIKDIIFPVDSGIVANEQVLEPLLRISKAYKSEVKVLHLKTQKVVAGYDPGIEYFLKDVKHSFHTVTGSKDVNGMINLFVVEENADMICMIRRERSFWENVFHRSATLKEIFDSPVPLLILHDSE